ncbi:hypothetical protein NKG60_26410 [Mesorhizobium sp. M1428]|uniref:hypothetical protein n=1 Tax=unclassified Mesorhizobium TaxID=325217 RepID=UPI00333952A9
MILGAFDIMYLDGHDLRDIGCKARREILFSIIKPNSRIQFSESIPGEAGAGPCRPASAWEATGDAVGKAGGGQAAPQAPPRRAQLYTQRFAVRFRR